MTKYFFDTEFNEDGSTIDLISIGIVREDGKEFYAVVKDADWGRIYQEPWLVANVVPHLPDEKVWLPKSVVAQEVYGFLTSTREAPELWAWFSAYDHVALAQLWGKMIHLPKPIPMFTNDFRSYVDFLNPRLKHQLPKQPATGLHDALEDAKFLKLRYDWVQDWKASHGESHS